MPSLDDLDRAVALALHREALIFSTLRALRVALGSASGLPTLFPAVLEAKLRAETELDRAAAERIELQLQLESAHGRVRELAQRVTIAARCLRLAEAEEEELVALLGTHTIPAEGLTESEHRYIVSALEAREATGLAAEEAVPAWLEAWGALSAERTAA